MRENLENTFQVFLLLKLIYRTGKTKLPPLEFAAIKQMMQFAKSASLQKHLDKLVELKWLHLNQTTQYYQIASFDRIRQRNNWVKRYALPIHFMELNFLFAMLGAAIFTYLHKRIKYKLRTDGFVVIKGTTFHSRQLQFDGEIFTPTAINGATKFFQINHSKVKRIRQEAIDQGLIEVKKSNQYLHTKHHNLKALTGYSAGVTHAYQKNDWIVIPQIGKISPNITLRKRHKLTS